MRKHHDVAQRQHRIGPAVARLAAWVWRRSWPQVLIVVPLVQDPRMRRRDELPGGWAGALADELSAPRAIETLPGCSLRDTFVRHSSSDTIRGDAYAGVSRKPDFAAKSAAWRQHTDRRRGVSEMEAPDDTSHHSGARAAGIAGAIGTVGVDVERPRGALDDFARDHDLLDAFEARQIEHGVEQDALHDRAQPARAGLAVDRLAGDRRQAPRPPASDRRSPSRTCADTA